jgi:hypothetical protein
VRRAKLPSLRNIDCLSVLKEFRPWLSTIKTYKTCLACLQRTPEFKFSCSHMICEYCCVELGQRVDRDPDLFTFATCSLCSEDCNIQIRIKPATAGLRVLSIDGGGIRAVVPIQFLRALEQAIGLDMPVQEHFDLSFGTSSGTVATLNVLLSKQTNILARLHGEFSSLRARIAAGRSI